MVEPRLIKLRNDKHIKEPRKNVFLCDYLRSVGVEEKDDVYISIKDILIVWGCEDFYEEMIGNFSRLIRNNPDENICVNYEMGEFDNNKERQKLLEWNIYDERKKEFGLVGGVLFQYGEMSFHT